MNFLLELPQSLFNPNGTASHTIFNLTSIVFLTFSVVGVVMWILIGWAALRRRGSFDWHAPVGSNDGRSWIYVGGLLVPGIVLTVVFILGLRSLSAFPIHADHHPTADIRLVGHQWWWDVQYLGAPDRQVRTANEIHIPVGRDVMLELVSADVIHSFWVPSLHGKMDLIPGEANYLSLHAENAGTYRGQCAELCGVQHANMILLVVAESQQDYEKWLGHQREEASAESASAGAEGRNVFLSKPCALCHTIRGTPARAGVAPDLTHFASRQRLASNMLSNDEANLAAWITHAQSLKPGAAMPDVTQFSGEELQAIVAYLRLLK